MPYKIIENVAPHYVGSIDLGNGRVVGIGDVVSDAEKAAVEKYYVLDLVSDSAKSFENK